MTDGPRVGDRFPNLELRLVEEGGVRAVSTEEVVGEGVTVLFGVPGAFTETCSSAHLPGFRARSDDLFEAGADRIVCAAVNDAAVLAAWAESAGVSSTIAMLADGNGELARALGLTLDLSVAGMGTRMRRFAALVEDGVVRWIGVEPGRDVGVSSAETVLAELRRS